MGDRKFSRDVHGLTKGIILLSGGIDSATTLYLAHKYGYRLYALIFDYNQRHGREIECARRIAQLNKINYSIIRVYLPWVRSSLTDRRIDIPFDRDLKKKDIPSTYVSGRNIIFLSYAASYADSIQAKKIFIGAHIQDYSGYPDCRPEFINGFQGAVNLGIKNRGMEIIAPLIDKSKREIISLGRKLGVPFQHTWSCYRGNAFPCGRCDSCRFRIEAFKAAGMNDPLLRRRK